MKPNNTKKLVYSALFLALALVLPFLTGQIQTFGQMLAPMHLPVLLCGFVCGPVWGLAVGAVAPLLRSLLFSMPPMFPTAVAMAFELAAYGAIAGFLYQRSRWQCLLSLYRALLIAMVGGRVVWGVVRVALTGVAGEAFTWELFMAGAFFNAVPGIVLQLVFIPALMVALDRTGMVRFSRNRPAVPAAGD